MHFSAVNIVHRAFKILLFLLLLLTLNVIPLAISELKLKTFVRLTVVVHKIVHKLSCVFAKVRYASDYKK